MAHLLLRSLACCAVAAMLAVGPVPAESAQTNLAVRAVVLKHARLTLLSQPSSVVITAADISRGYVDVPAPAELAIRSNSPAGYALEFMSSGEFVRRINVVGLGGEVQLSPSGGVVTRASSVHGMSTTTLRLAFRFMLDGAAKAGTYPWPMQLSIVPL